MSKKLRLSYTKLSLYLDCPARYYYRYVEKRPYYPTTMMRYGSNIHRALKDVSEVARSGLTLDKGKQAELYEKQWSDVSKDKDSNQALKELGISQVSEFIDKNQSTLQQNTLFLEKSFTFPLDDLILTGYIDRVDTIENDRVEIIDYKTGSIRPIFEDDLQLNFYALICRDYLNLTPAKLSLYFLKSNDKLTVDCKNKFIEQVRGLILDTAEKIAASKFNPDPVPYDECSKCCYSRFCEYLSVS